MDIKDLVYAKKVIVQIVWGERVIEFPTEVLEERGNGVLVKPYIYQDKPLELNITTTSGVVCNIFANQPNTDLRMGWRNMELTTIDRKGEKIYHIQASGHNRQAATEDRRRHDRIYLHKSGAVFDEPSNRYIPVMIHNVSDNGISFYAPKEFEPRSSNVTVLLEDFVNERAFQIRVPAKIVRASQKTGTDFYGCKVDNAPNDYLIYGCLKRIAVAKKAEQETMYE